MLQLHDYSVGLITLQCVFYRHNNCSLITLYQLMIPSTKVIIYFTQQVDSNSNLGMEPSGAEY